MQTVIGVVGPKGAGKGAFVKLLRERLPEKTFEVLRFSDVLYETLKVWDVPASRENLQKLAVMMNEMGNGALSHAIRARALRSNANIVILDGVRWESDVAVLRSFRKNLLVYICTDANIRFRRLKARNEKVGEGTMTWEQFEREERALNEVLIAQIGGQADFRVRNNGPLDELSHSVDAFVRIYKTAL